MRLEGKNVLVTGASAGMGNAITKLFVKEGANVLAVARRAERLEDLKKELEGEAGYKRLEDVIKLSPEPGKPEDIANAALFLASDDSSYVNRDVLIVDGGWTTN